MNQTNNPEIRCLTCRHLSHDGSHLNEYLNDQLAQDATLYTCKAETIDVYFRSTWLFGIGKYGGHCCICTGKDWEPKIEQLELFK